MNEIKKDTQYTVRKLIIAIILTIPTLCLFCYFMYMKNFIGMVATFGIAFPIMLSIEYIMLKTYRCPQCGQRIKKYTNPRKALIVYSCDTCKVDWEIVLTNR